MIICVNVRFHFGGDKCPGVQLLGYVVSTCLGLLKNYQTLSQTGCIILHSHKKCMRNCFFASSPAFGIVAILNFSHFNRCVLIARCGYHPLSLFHGADMLILMKFNLSSFLCVFSVMSQDTWLSSRS